MDYSASKLIVSIVLTLKLCQGFASAVAPLVSYCVSLDHVPHCVGSNAAETNISNNSFNFSNISSQIITRKSIVERTNLYMDIVLICRAAYPIKWLAEKPIQENMDVLPMYSMESAPDGTMKFLYAVQVLVDLCSGREEISGRWRCQSFENPNIGADLYVNSKIHLSSIPSNQCFLNESVFINKGSISSPTSNLENSHLKERDRIPTIYHVCGNETKEEILENNYDPRIGFRINSQPNLSCYHKCCHNQMCHEIVPLDWGKRTRASLIYSKTILRGEEMKSVECQSELELDGRLMVGQCNSVVECELKFAPLYPEIYLNATVISSIHKKEQIKFGQAKGIGSFQLDHSFSNGYVACFSDYQFPGNFLYETGFFFTGLDNKIYPLSQEIPTQSMISLTTTQLKNRKFLVNCTISKFLLESSVYFEVGFSDGSTVLVRCTEDKNELEAEFHELATNRNKVSWGMELQVSSTMKNISCSSPWLNSPKVATAGIDFPKSVNSLDEEEDLRISVSAIIAIAVSTAVVVLVAAAALGRYWIKYRLAVNVINKLAREEIQAFYNGNLDTQLEKDQAVADTDSFPFPEQRKITNNNLVLSANVLGEGEFGIVCEGKLEGRLVAVKSTKPNADLNYFRAFLQEIKVMAYIAQENHDNIVGFLGAVVDNIHENICLAVIEHSEVGNLSGYLRCCSRKYSATTGADSSKTGKLIAIKDPAQLTQLISFGSQIAAGMEFLVLKKVIHGDLAARNVLVFENDVVKITDFGLSRKLYNCANYVKTQQVLLPWRWMAPESLRFFKFSSESDVWSYGVTLWEIFSLGEVPFTGLHYVSDFPDKIEAGLRLTKPAWATDNIYLLMNLCWTTNAKIRITISECRAELEGILKLTRDLNQSP